MNAITPVLIKVFAREFYRANAPFFFIAAGLCFGFMSGVEHKALALSFVSSQALITIPIGVWLFYMVKIIRFNQSVIGAPQHEFIYTITLLKASEQWIALFPILIIQFIPALVYASFLILTAYTFPLTLPILEIILSTGMIIIVSTATLFVDLKYQGREEKITHLKKLTDTRFAKSYIQIIIEWIIRKNTVAFLGVKISGCIILLGITNLYFSDAYDWRLLGMGLTIAFSGNVTLLFYLHRFENFHFQILRQLPLSMLRRFFTAVCALTILCLPEYGIVIRNFPKDLQGYMLVTSVVFSISLLMLFYSSMYITHTDLRKITKIVFMIATAELLFILFNVPLWLISVLNLSVGIPVFRKYFYRYEMTRSNE